MRFKERGQKAPDIQSIILNLNIFLAFKKISKDAMLTGIIIFSIVTIVTLYILLGARQS